VIRYISTTAPRNEHLAMFSTLTLNTNSRQAVSSRVRCTPAAAWLDTAEMFGFAGTYAGIKHPTWRPPEDPM